MKRSPMPKRRVPIQRATTPLSSRGGLIRKPMKQGRSKKQKIDAEALDAITPELLGRSKGWCEMGFDGCLGRATHRHHRQGRSTGDHRLVNLLHLCRPCHEFGHAHPELARRIGFTVSSIGTQKPEDVPCYDAEGGSIIR